MKFQKHSKKGFTLVELVVVIAILGILAAIAIPSVVGIINNAQNNSKESNAEQLTSAVKLLYSGVAGGTITKETPDDELNALAASKSTKLPSKEDTVSTKKAKADALVLQDAVDYLGLTSKFNATNIKDYGYNPTDSTIYFMDTLKDDMKTKVTQFGDNALTTVTLKTIRTKAAAGT